MAMIAWWKLDGDVLDSWVNGYNGSNNGVSFVTGKKDQAGFFENTNLDYIRVDNSPTNIISTTTMSMSFWFKYVSDASQFARIISSDNGDLQIYSQTDWVDGLRAKLGSDGTARLIHSFDFSTGNWIHVVITINGDTVTTYVNNGTGTVTAFSGIGTIDFDIFDIGRAYGAVNYLDAQLDDIRIYDHALSSDEISALNSTQEFVIDGYSYSNAFRDGEFTQTALFRLRNGDIEFLDDSSNTIVNRLENGHDIQIFIDHVLRFRGLIENFDFTEDKIVNINMIDYSFYLAEDFVTYVATAESASTIVTNLINLYGNNLFTLNITATTKLYTKIWRAYSPLEIIQELALDEGYTYFTNETRQFNFVPQNYNDTGITLVDGTTIFTRKFPHDNTKLKNKIIVIGKGATNTAGIRAVVRDPISIKKFGLRSKRIEDTSIETEDHAIERAESELTRLANPLIIGELTTDRDFTLSAGSIVRITLPQKIWVAKEFLILEAEHELETPLSHLMLAEINPLNSDQLGEVLFKQRITTKNWEDDAIPVTQFERWIEEIIFEGYLYVETQSSVNSRDWNENDWNDNTDWDFVPGAWSVVTGLNGVKMVITNNGLNRMRDLLVGKAVTVLDSANANITIGAGTTSAQITDIAMETESYRKLVDSGFPRDGTVDGENEHQSSWSDSDFVSGTFTEIGILDEETFSIDATGNAVTFADVDPDTITRVSGSWITDGLAIGDSVVISGSTSNDGTYTIDAITALVLTLISTDTLVSETNTTTTITFKGGTLIARVVPSTSFSKALNENLRVRLKTVFKQ